MLRDRRLAGALIAIVVGALILDATTGTLGRHVIETVPALLALAAILRRRRWVSYAAMPVAVFWLVITAITWMSELGLVSRIAGPTSTLHLFLMAAIGAAAVAALAAAALSRSTATVAARLGAFWAFAILQLAALWLSLRLP
ncbi:MAG TPA: hypothetical protein VND92_04995 [Vicinamibacterales bacterium]|nr:hypothetical protein [Vicinamibacterales bacterium]